MRPSYEKYFMSSKYCCLFEESIRANKQNLQRFLCIPTLSNGRKNFIHVESNYCNQYVWFVKIISLEKTAGDEILRFTSLCSFQQSFASSVHYTSSPGHRQHSKLSYFCQMQQNECQKLTTWQSWWWKW